MSGGRKKSDQNEDERNIKCQKGGEKNEEGDVKYLIRSIIVAICHMSLSTRSASPCSPFSSWLLVVALIKFINTQRRSTLT
jgi:hypothetical protein